MDISEATVLLVDDEPELLEIYGLWVERRGAKVLTAPNGAVALKLLAEEHVDVLVTDIRMPVMDGIKLVRRLKEEGRTVPSIIFISGFADIDVREAYELGVEAMLSKPTRQNQLLSAIERTLKDRETVWAEPLPEVPTYVIEMEFPSFTEAHESGAFNLGRGGFCLYTGKLIAHEHVRLQIRFHAEDQCIAGQGCVQWTDAGQRKVGVEFLYLGPECRAWVAERIGAVKTGCFIPSCT